MVATNDRKLSSLKRSLIHEIEVDHRDGQQIFAVEQSLKLTVGPRKSLQNVTLEPLQSVSICMTCLVLADGSVLLPQEKRPYNQHRPANLGVGLSP